MIRYTDLGLVLIAVVLTAGCRDSKPESPPPIAPAPAEAATPAVPADQATPEPVAAAKPSGTGSPMGETQVEGEKPTALGAIGKALGNTLGGSGQDEPSEAPAYRPR
jgi:hypothetical protein